MSPIGTPVEGAFPLDTVANLPNVSVAYPGEVWSDRKASGAVRPGAAVVPTASAGRMLMREAQAGDAVTQMAIAMRTIDVPDQNPGSQYAEALGPNQIRNLTIAAGDYILAGYSGAFHLTLIKARSWIPGDLVGWHPTDTPQTGKSGAGCWAKYGDSGVIGPLFEVHLFRPINGSTTEGILTVRSLRGQGPV